MNHLRRLFMGVLGCTLLAAVVLAQGVPAEPKKAPEFYSAVTLVRNNDAQKLVHAVEDLIQQAKEAADEETRSEILGRAASALVSLLEVEEDAFVELRRKGPDGTETVRTVGIRAEANRLLATLPSQGLQFYELQAGQKAKLQLARARTEGDIQILRDVIQRYPQTEACDEALALLGTYHLDRRRYVMAAPCFERLLQREEAAKLSPRVLFKAALAFARAGYRTHGERAWNLLAARVQRDGGFRVGDQNLSLEQLRKIVDRKPEAEQVAEADWGLYRGAVDRAALSAGGVVALEPQWSVSALPEPEANGMRAARDWTEESLRRIDDTVQRQSPVLPGFSPLGVFRQRKLDGELMDLPLVIYRTHDALLARNLKTGNLEWQTPMERFRHETVNDPQKKMELEKWRTSYQSVGQPGLMFENSVIGSLSTDDARVFVIDDLPMPLSPPSEPRLAWAGIQQQAVGGPFQADLEHNILKAYNLVTGKAVWELKTVVDKHKPDGGKPASSSFFSGPPLALDGKLYVLHEQDGEVRLVCLQCASLSPSHEQVEVLWVQPLATLKERLLMDVNRRIQATHLAYSDGILVCPTNAGAVLGVDLLSRSLVWSHNYREGEETPKQPQPVVPGGRVRRIGVPLTVNVNPRWKSSAPIIQDGKIVFSAPDGAAIHCLSLRDGRLLWKEPRTTDDLYLGGVHQGKVVIVGKGGCRALSLTEGKALWKIENTGLPSGQGMIAGNVFYLPLRIGADSAAAEVCAIDLNKGTITNRIKAPRGDVPGNLIYFQGTVLSQSLANVTAFPQTDTKQARRE